MHLEELAVTLQRMKNLSKTINKKADDCVWITEKMLRQIESDCRVMCTEQSKESLKFAGPYTISGIVVFVDEDLPEGMIETGTYKVENGQLKRCVRHRYACPRTTSGNR